MIAVQHNGNGRRTRPAIRKLAVVVVHLTDHHPGCRVGLARLHHELVADVDGGAERKVRAARELRAVAAAAIVPGMIAARSFKAHSLVVDLFQPIALAGGLNVVAAAADIDFGLRRGGEVRDRAVINCHSRTPSSYNSWGIPLSPIAKARDRPRARS